jgi:hypothetical protein
MFAGDRTGSEVKFPSDRGAVAGDFPACLPVQVEDSLGVVIEFRPASVSSTRPPCRLNREVPRAFSRACTRWLMDAWVRRNAFAAPVKLLNSATLEKLSKYGSCGSSSRLASITDQPHSSPPAPIHILPDMMKPI